MNLLKVIKIGGSNSYSNEFQYTEALKLSYYLVSRVNGFDV